MLTTLILTTVIFFFLTLYSILQSNLTLFEIEEAKLWSLKVLDTNSAATLFVTLVGALLVRHQFAISVLPRINYISNIKTNPSRYKSGMDSEMWQVEIRNTGLGPAIIERIDYFLELSNSKDMNNDYQFSALIRKLTEVEISRSTDYNIANISSGFSLAPKDELMIFEIKSQHLTKFNRLSMMIYFQGQLGDKYCREISLLAKPN